MPTTEEKGTSLLSAADEAFEDDVIVQGIRASKEPSGDRPSPADVAVNVLLEQLDPADAYDRRLLERFREYGSEAFVPMMPDDTDTPDYAAALQLVSSSVRRLLELHQALKHRRDDTKVREVIDRMLEPSPERLWSDRKLRFMELIDNCAQIFRTGEEAAAVEMLLREAQALDARCVFRPKDVRELLGELAEVDPDSRGKSDLTAARVAGKLSAIASRPGRPGPFDVTDAEKGAHMFRKHRERAQGRRR